MTNEKLESLDDLVLATTTYLYGENTPYTALADAGKIPLSLMDARYLLLAGGTMDGNIDLADNLLQNVEQACLNLAPATSPGIGEIQWNATDGTIDIGLLGGTVVLQVGQEVNAYVVQKTGTVIANGKAVIVIGVSGERLEVALTDLTNLARSATSGLTTESIDNNQQGYMTTFGLVRDLDTSMWAEGAFIWADGSTPGDLTDTRPTSPLRGVFIGFVVRSHASLGSIWVFPFNIPRLQFLSDVFAATPSDGDYLRWSAANSRWELSAT